MTDQNEVNRVNNDFGAISVRMLTQKQCVFVFFLRAS